MNEPIWIRREALLFLHSASLAAHGGASGIRDEGLLDSALARPRNRFLYEPETDIAGLAASYAFGLAQNHPFVDGNKRAAFHALGLFLSINGFEVVAGQVDAIQTILAIAASQLSEDRLAEWIRTHSRCV
jgi:death-on-curing protein